MRNPERNADAMEAIRTLVKGNQLGIWTAIPAIVQRFDAAKMVVDAQPTIQARQQNDDGTTANITMPILPYLPIVYMSGGGYTITVPLAVGDEGLVVFSSRCIDAWWQSGGVQAQLETRAHDVSDGIFIPGLFSQPRVLANVSTSLLEIRNDARSVMIQVDKTGSIKLKAPTVNIEAASTNVSGNMVVTGDVTAGGVSVKTHTHSGVTTGTGNSGVPN